MKAIIFSRVSTLSQDLEQQEQVLFQTAKSEGYKDSDIIFISEHESGVKNDISERLGLSRAKDAIAQGDVEVIYAFELSRIARRLDVFYDFRKFLIENKVQLKIMNPRVNLLTESGEIDENFTLVFSIFASLAEQEARLMQSRFKRGKAKLKSENKYTGGSIIYGYSANKNHEYIINEEQAAIIRRIFTEYQTRTVVDIAKDMVFENILPTATVNSTATLIRHILHREEYYGKEVEVGGFKRKYPAIISKAEYDEAAKKFVERKKYCKTRSKHAYLCRGLIFNINNQPLKALFCHNTYTYCKPKKYTWETLSFNMNLMDSIALHYAIENKKNNPSKDIAKVKAELRNEIKNIDKKVAVIKDKIASCQESIMKLEMRYASGKITEQMLDILVEKVNKEMSSLEADGYSLEAHGEELRLKLNRNSSPLLSPLEELSIDEKIKIVHEEIERITVIKGDKMYNYTLGIEYTNGSYIIIDVNSRTKKVFDESGKEIKYQRSAPN